MGDLNAKYLAYVREMIASTEQRHTDMTKQMKLLEGECTKIVEDLNGWREIESLVAEKVGEVTSARSSDGDTTSPHGDDGDAETSQTGVTACDNTQPISPEQGQFAGMTHAGTAAVALRRIGHPATAATIRDELLKMGHHINDDNKLAANILYNSMGRQPNVFRKIEGGRWQLIEMHQPPLFDEGA